MVRQRADCCLLFNIRVHERQCNYVTLYFVTKAPLFVTRDKLRFNVASCDNYRGSVHDIMTHKNRVTSDIRGVCAMFVGNLAPCNNQIETLKIIARNSA